MLDRDVVNLLHCLYWKHKVTRKALEEGTFPYVYSPDTLDDIETSPVIREKRGQFDLISGYTSFLKVMDGALENLPTSEHFFSYPILEKPRKPGSVRPAFLAIPYAKAFTPVKNAICRAATTTGFDCDVTGDRYLAGNVMDQVWQGIRRAEFVVADISGFNANVMIEVGMAVSLGKPVLIISQSKEMPFDVQPWRRMIYDRKDLKGLQQDITHAFQAAPTRYPMDNDWWKNDNRA